VAVFDKRLLTKSYGQFFIDSLPDPTVHRGSLALLPRAAAEWLQVDGPRTTNKLTRSFNSE
jgi:hypothetical protein